MRLSKGRLEEFFKSAGWLDFKDHLAEQLAAGKEEALQSTTWEDFIELKAKVEVLEAIQNVESIMIVTLEEGDQNG